MPVYEFICETCKGWTVERFYPSIPRTVPSRVTDTCRNCGETNGPFKKIISRTSFALGREGVGWARDGYSRSSQDGSKIVSLTEPK